MHLPPKLLESLEGIKGFDKEAFIKVHESGEQVTSVRVNPFKLSNVKSETSNMNPFHLSGFTFHDKVSWTENGFYLSSRPSFTFDPLFHAGCYYVQEASSMFLEQALKQTVDLTKPLRVLDLCAAPGGKSTHLLSMISQDSLLVSNEVIKSRANILKDNIIKWGCANVVVTNNDPRDFQQLENYFDVIVVDAPCSGSGLFRREPEAINEWSEQNVLLCSQRQQRILADVLPALKEGGILIYSTCSYSKEEDEDLVNWLSIEWSMVNRQLSIDPGWNITNTDGGYRFWPDKIKGEGFFIACFKKQGNEADNEYDVPKVKTEKFSKQELEVLTKFVKTEGVSFLRHGKMLRAVPEKLLPDISSILSRLRIVSCGIEVGEIIKDKLVPEHALAVSNILGDDVCQLELDQQQAIRYLQKKDIELRGDKKGWAVVTYERHPLGWVNILPNRINNYYPKELRILKEQNT